jgi:hypothetical protein
MQIIGHDSVVTSKHYSQGAMELRDIITAERWEKATFYFRRVPPGLATFPLALMRMMVDPVQNTRSWWRYIVLAVYTGLPESLSDRPTSCLRWWCGDAEGIDHIPNQLLSRSTQGARACRCEHGDVGIDLDHQTAMAAHQERKRRRGADGGRGPDDQTGIRCAGGVHGSVEWPCQHLAVKSSIGRYGMGPWT